MAEVKVIVLVGFTVIVPVAFTAFEQPVKGMLYGKVPVAVGVPLIVIILLFQTAVTPAGNPVTPLLFIPFAFIVV
ncbi:hypothetical protein D3C86_1848460 [compost metagenome]